MSLQFTNHGNCIEFKYNTAPQRFFVSNELAKQLGGIEGIKATFDRVKGATQLWPRQSSHRRPWTPLDFELRRRNVELGRHHWKYNPSCIVGNTRYYGYGHWTNDGFQFYDWNPEEASGSPVNGRKVY